MQQRLVNLVTTCPKTLHCSYFCKDCIAGIVLELLLATINNCWTGFVDVILVSRPFAAAENCLSAVFHRLSVSLSFLCRCGMTKTKLEDCIGLPSGWGNC